MDSLRAVAEHLEKALAAANASDLVDFVRRSVESGSQFTIAVARCLDAPPEVTSWLRTQVAPAEVWDVTADITGAELWLADRVVIAFSGTSLPSARLLRELAGGPHLRPTSTVAVLSCGVELAESEEDLNVIEGAARRWMLPPSDSPNETSLNCLWASQPVAVASIADRVEADCQQLMTWLKTPLTAEETDELQRRRLLMAVEWVEARSPAPVQEDSSKDFHRAQSALAELRAQALVRLRSDGDALENGIRVATDGMEHDLKANLPQFMARHAAQLANSNRADELLAAYCREAVERWAAQPRAALRQWDRTLAELDELVRSCPAWEFIRQVTGRNEYPEQIASILAAAHPELRPPVASPLPERPAPSSTTATSEAIAVALVGAMIGAGACAAVGLSAGFAAVGAAFGGAVGASIRRHQRHDRRRAQIESSLQASIAEIARLVRKDLNSMVALCLGKLRGEIITALDEAAAALDEHRSSIVARGQDATSGTESLASVRQQLNQWNRDSITSPSD